MTQMKRFAVYFAPRPGAFATRAAAWMGWDALSAQPVAQPDVPDIAALTADPRKYGFHATLRAPFRLGPGVELADVMAGVAALAARLAPAECQGLQLANLDGFLALIPQGDDSQINRLAGEVVTATNHLHASLTEAEITRRRPEHLTERQKNYLADYGYPHVFEEFQFHLTLTGRLDANRAADMAQAVDAHFGAALPRPFSIEDLCLFGEDVTGRFHLLHRYALLG